jgi:hypothetical protein
MDGRPCSLRSNRCNLFRRAMNHQNRPVPRWPIRRETMDWFSRTTSIAGIQVPNYWMLVLVAVVVIWIIYSFVAH